MKNIFNITNNFSADLSGSVLKWGNEQEEKSLISIVIPVYNRFEFFKKALDSALKQNISIPYSIIVTDNNYDNDIDNENAYEKYILKINSPKVLYYKNKKNLGPVGNFNRGIQLCKSEYYVMCHEDDELCEDCLDELWKFKLKHRVKKEIILPHYVHVDENSSPVNDFTRKKKKIYNRIGLIDWFLGCLTNGCGALINRDAVLEIGGYNENYRPCADYALFSLYSYTFGAYRLKDRLYKYRIGKTNLSNNTFYTVVERDEFIRSCIKDKIHAPDFVLNRIIFANKKYHIECAEKKWLKKVIHPTPKIDRIIMKVVYMINATRHLFWL